MIITRTPFRISFAGGGTDLKDFYRIEPGAVVSMTINKYMYITVNKRFDNTIRISYSKTEIVSQMDEIQHPIVREALKLVGIEGGIEIVSIADIPSGTGLGSSSSFTVGLLNALHAYKGHLQSADSLAKEACQIEIDILGEPIGKQDQFIAAYGGLCHIQFNQNESVFVNPFVFTEQIKKLINQNILLLYTGESRLSSSILSDQKKNIHNEDMFRKLQKLRDLAQETKLCLTKDVNPLDLGTILHRGWLLKKELADNISNSIIDSYYEKALSAGAYGGKILGAGGGGFLLLVCPQEKRQTVRNALSALSEISCTFEPEGSKIIYIA